MNNKTLNFTLTTQILLILILGLFSPLKVEAQQTPPVAPDCVMFVSLASAANTAAFDNRVIGCVTWTLSYQSTGFSGLTLTFQSANGAVTAGAFGTYAGTVSTGSNPETSTTGAVATFANGVVSTPWLRVSLSGLTGVGNVTGVVYGYKTGPTGGNGGGTGSACPGTTVTPCVVVGVAAPGAAISGAPVPGGIEDTSGNAEYQAAANRVGDANAGGQIPSSAPSLFNGATWDRALTCTSNAIFVDSTVGNTQVIPASGATKIHICKWSFITGGAVNVQLNQGTGVNCAGGTASLSFQYILPTVTAVAEDYVADQSPLTTAASQAVCVNLTPGGPPTVSGQIFYDQF